MTPANPLRGVIGEAASEAVNNALGAIRLIGTIARDERLGADERLHYLRTIRLNLAGQEDFLAGLDDLAPCIAEKLADIHHAIHHHAANPED